MKTKNLILVFLLLKIVLTMKSDSCPKDEPIIINEEISETVNIRSSINLTSISFFELDSSLGQTWNAFSSQVTDSSDS